MCLQNWQITYCKENNNRTKTIPLDKFLGVVMWAAASLLHPENQIRGEHETLAVVAGQYSVKYDAVDGTDNCDVASMTSNLRMKPRDGKSRRVKPVPQKDRAILRGPLFHLGISSAFL